jgi:hypothetical protein
VDNKKPQITPDELMQTQVPDVDFHHDIVERLFQKAIDL